MNYIKPHLPDKEIEYCLEFFEKDEAKKRILSYINGILNDAESQYNLLKSIADLILLTKHDK